MIQGIRGTKDILPDDIAKWYFVEKVLKDVSRLYGYLEIRTPIFESTDVFLRSIGENTDIVNKEMYTFLDKGGDSITLRPEQTAALVRSVIQNSMLHQHPLLRLWYFGPYFRYERPQKGRMRQFHQYGAECIGSAYPESDVEMLLLANSIIKTLGIENYSLYLNSLGNESSRKKFKNELVRYFNSVADKLSEDSRSRLANNPLRILDSKDNRDAQFISEAPQIIDFLDDESQYHFNYIKSSLNDLNIDFIIQPRLVRGLDYYTHTVFEFQSSILGAQDSFGGGGRYDSLFEQLGGKPTPAVGFALGIERIILILESLHHNDFKAPSPEIYIITSSSDYLTFAYKVSEYLRRKNINVITDLMRKTIKSQLREANKFNIKYAIIIGQQEFDSNNLTIKNMSDGTQHQIKFDNLDNYKFS